MTANLLVLLLPDGSETRLRSAIAERDEIPNVHVVTPIRVGALAWLASDEDDAWAEASVRAFEAERLLGDEADVEGEAGDADPVQAVEDALRSFPADEILIVGRQGEDGDLDASLWSFGLPVTRLGGSSPRPGHRRLREAARGVVAGRSKATPFVLFAGVNLALLMLAAAIAVIVMLVLLLR